MKQMKMMSQNKGFTLPELVLGAAVLGLAAIAVLSAGKNILDGQRSDGFVNYHLDITSRINSFYSPEYDYSDVSVAGLTATIPTNTAGDALRPPYSASTGTVIPVTGQDNLYAVHYTGLPRGQCTKVVNTLGQRAVGVQLFDGSVAAGAEFAIASASMAKDLTSGKDMSRAELNTGCSGSSAVFSVTFVMQ